MSTELATLPNNSIGTIPVPDDHSLDSMLYSMGAMEQMSKMMARTECFQSPEVSQRGQNCESYERLRR